VPALLQRAECLSRLRREHRRCGVAALAGRAGFSQRFIGIFADGAETIDGRRELREDDVNWNNDLQII